MWSSEDFTIICLVALQHWPYKFLFRGLDLQKYISLPVYFRVPLDLPAQSSLGFTLNIIRKFQWLWLHWRKMLHGVALAAAGLHLVSQPPQNGTSTATMSPPLNVFTARIPPRTELYQLSSHLQPLHSKAGTSWRSETFIFKYKLARQSLALFNGSFTAVVRRTKFI